MDDNQPQNVENIDNALGDTDTDNQLIDLEPIKENSVEEPKTIPDEERDGDNENIARVDVEDRVGEEQVEGEQIENEPNEDEKGNVEDQNVDGEHENINGEQENVEGEHENVEGDLEHVEGEHVDEIQTEVEEVKLEKDISEDKESHVDELASEELEDEQNEEERVEEEQKKVEIKIDEEVVEEEDVYVEEPPPDPNAPYDFSDSKEDLKAPFNLRPEQLAEVEQLWEYFQNYTPAYTDIDNYVTEKELVYMLKSLLLMTFTPEQLQELIEYCVRPPHPLGHINYDQFLKMVTIRQRDMPIEEELRSSLQVMDPGKIGTVDREFLREVLLKQGHKMPQKQLDNLIKEVDISNDGTIGIEDVIGTMCIDLNPEDLLMLKASLNPDTAAPPPDDDL